MKTIQQNMRIRTSVSLPAKWLTTIAVAGTIGYFGLIKPTLKEHERFSEQFAMEQAIQPTVLNYEGTDSVQIQRCRSKELFSKSDRTDYVYVKHADNLNNPVSDYELTTLVAEKGKVLYVTIETHVFKEKLPSRSQSHELLDFANYYELSGKYAYALPSFIAGKYQQKYDYYANKLDSLENVFKEQQCKQNKN